jgi:hypothetical protein
MLEAAKVLVAMIWLMYKLEVWANLRNRDACS